MNVEARSQKRGGRRHWLFRHSDFLRHSVFVIRHWCGALFCIRFSACVICSSDLEAHEFLVGFEEFVADFDHELEGDVGFFHGEDGLV